MNLVWLFPAGLAALAALLLPLLIHLARRSEHHLLDFAALRWLQAKARPRQRIRLDEWPLLLVRLLLLALLALLLARPALTGVPDTQPRIAVVPGLDISAVRQQLDAPDARWLWLAPGFPALDTAPAPGAGQPISSLLRELDAQLPAGGQLTVIVPAVLDGVDAQRPRLSREVQWQVLPSDPPADAIPARPAPTLVIRHDETASPALRYLRAASAAWRPQETAPSVDVAAVGQPLDTTSLAAGNVLVWLAASAPPPDVRQWVEDGGTLLLDARAPHDGLTFFATGWVDAAEPLLQQARDGNGRVLRFTRELVPAAMPALLDADFPQQLRAQLQPVAAPARADAAAHAPLRSDISWRQSPRELAPALLWLIALLFALERWMATSARREARA